MADPHRVDSIAAIIPARGGSKRLPGKNVLPLCGKPMIAWTIEAALGVDAISTILVSTDDPGIAAAAEAYGGTAPFLRPAALSTDSARTEDVVEHALRWLEMRGTRISHVMVLQPTSPLRTAADVATAIDVLRAHDANAVVSVCESDYPPEWMCVLPPDGALSALSARLHEARKGARPVYHRLNGAIYLCDRGRFLSEKTLFLPDRITAYVMPRERSVDVDTMTDFLLAEAILSRRGDATA